MKVLMVIRLFSGLADSFAQGRWEPSGVPAIYKLVEGLSHADNMEVSLVVLTRDFDERFARPRFATIEPFGIEALFLPWRRAWPNWLNELAQTLHVLSLIMRRHPDVAYFTNAGFVAAGLAARLRLVPVVLRFLGIFPIHKQLSEGGRAIVRWLYRAPFSHVVCSLDGSGGEHYLKRLLGENVPLSVLLNGVDASKYGDQERSKQRADLRQELGFDARPVVTFVGRLEESKGAAEFVSALLRLERIKPGSFQGLIVGNGSLRDAMTNMLSDGVLLERVRLVGAVPHHLVSHYLAATDIYVSLNRYGSLSNANLEALTSGTCMLMLEKDTDKHIDVATESLVPVDDVDRLPRNGTVDALANKLADLIDRPTEIVARGNRCQALAGRILESWDNRIAREIEIIREAAALQVCTPTMRTA